MTVFGTLIFSIAFASLIVGILSFKQKKSTFEFTALVDYSSIYQTPLKEPSIAGPKICSLLFTDKILNPIVSLSHISNANVIVVRVENVFSVTLTIHP